MPSLRVITRGRELSSTKSSGAPTASQWTGGRSNTAEPIANPSAGSANADAATAPAPCTVSVMNRRRLTVSPSKAPGMLRSAVYLEGGCLRGVSGTNSCSGSEGGRTLSIAAYRSGAGGPSGVGSARIALGMCRGGCGDQIGEPGDRVEVAERGQALEPERVQAVAGEQREIGIVGPDDPALAVVLQVALADRLDDQRQPRAGGVAVGRGRAGVDDRGRQQAALRAQDVRERLHATSANAAAAASTVRAMCSGVCAVDGNHASNCDGGGYTPRASSARHQAP